MARVLVCANRKGGVGKSVLAVNLGAILARRYPTLVIDADPQGTASESLETTEALPVVHCPDLAALERVLETARTGRGVAVVDCPPALPDPTAVALRYASLVVVPVLPSPASIRSVGPFLEGLAGGKVPALVVLNGCKAGTMAPAIAREALRAYRVRIARQDLGHRIIYARAEERRQAVLDVAPSSLAAVELMNLSREVTRLLMKG